MRLAEPREDQVRVRPEGVEHPDRGHAEGRRPALAEQRRRGVDLRDVAHVARRQLDLFERLDVAAQVAFALRPAIDQIEGEARDAAPRHRAQILDGRRSVQPHQIDHPPSTAIAWPVVKAAASLAR
jgi:hypothetical protein